MHRTSTTQDGGEGRHAAPAVMSRGAPPDSVPDSARSGSGSGPRSRPGWASASFWTRERLITTAITLAGVAAAVVFVWLQLQPGLILTDNTPAGGDMGAHVWGPDYLRREVLAHFSLSWWTPDWYAGFAAYRFYMVVPALLVLAVDAVPGVPYGVAFKLVTVSGLVTMPVSAWAMAKLFRLGFPGPLLVGTATLPFIFDFDERFRIIGGNAASTLAGEFAFSISLSLCLLYLGVVARGLETGRYRWIGALLFALVVLNHLIPALFAVVATVVLGLWRLGLDSERPTGVAMVGGFMATVVGGAWAGYTGSLPLVVAVALPLLAVVALVVYSLRIERAWRSTLAWVAPVGLVGASVTAFWSLPFVRGHAYFNDMGWERLQLYAANLRPPTSLTLVWYAVFALAIVAVVLSMVERCLLGGFLASMALVMGVLFATWPDSQMWNARFLPFYYLSLYLLAGVGLALFVRVLPGLGLQAVAASLAAITVLGAVALPFGIVPGSTLTASTGQWSLFGIVDAPPSFIDDWARWNYSGYEGKAAWPEYEALVDTMAQVGSEQGCGRAMWEYQTTKLDSYGTPMALMLLPYWTDGCIGSMEGLYFESSATTPYHFLNQTALSESPSQAQRGLPYQTFDIDTGVQHLQLMGVRYYMALSDRAKSEAATSPDLTFLRASGPWDIFEVAGSELVTPLVNEPAVLQGLAQDQTNWLPVGTAFFNDPSRWDVMLAADGPDTWPRITAGSTPPAEPVVPAQVSDISTTNDEISFSVDRVGSPVLVKASYFPNWNVDGAEGPYRVTPNLMVVVPTDSEVRLHYGRTVDDWAGMVLSVLGLGAVVVLAFRPPLSVRRRPVAAEPSPPTVTSTIDLSPYELTFAPHAPLSPTNGNSHPPSLFSPAPRHQPVVSYEPPSGGLHPPPPPGDFDSR